MKHLDEAFGVSGKKIFVAGGNGNWRIDHRGSCQAGARFQFRSGRPEIWAATVERPRGMEDCTAFPDNAIRKRHSVSVRAQSRISHAR